MKHEATALQKFMQKQRGVAMPEELNRESELRLDTFLNQRRERVAAHRADKSIAAKAEGRDDENDRGR